MVPFIRGDGIWVVGFEGFWWVNTEWIGRSEVLVYQIRVHSLHCFAQPPRSSYMIILGKSIVRMRSALDKEVRISWACHTLIMTMSYKPKRWLVPPAICDLWWIILIICVSYRMFLISHNLVALISTINWLVFLELNPALVIPPILTANLSSTRKPGMVFLAHSQISMTWKETTSVRNECALYLVSNIRVGLHLGTLSTIALVCVATPLIRCIIFNAIRSATSRDRADPVTEPK